MEADDVSLFPRKIMVTPRLACAAASQHNSKAAASTSRCAREQLVHRTHCCHQQLPVPQSHVRRECRSSTSVWPSPPVSASLCSMSQEDKLLRLSGPAAQHDRQLHQRAGTVNEMHDTERDQHASTTGPQAQGKRTVASLQDFEKLGLLGTGGAAVVYLVRHRASHELFALKVQQISPSDLQNRQTQRAFKELQLLKVLRHPFIARLHDAFQDGTNLCLVMELYEGGNLNDIQTFCGGVFQEREARFYATELVLALEYVHTMGFVYRDLKPQNVLLHRDGHIHLTDFGVAQHGDHVGALGDPFSGADDRVRLRSTSFVGTMDYMAPEMIQQKAQSTDVDWWTLGCLLYELLYGTPPFSHSAVDSNQDGGPSSKDLDPATLFKEILKCRVHFPAEPRVSDDCKDLLRRLLEKNPEKRLGHRFGASEVKHHRFFHGTQWALVGNQPPPVVMVSSSSCVQRFHPSNEALEDLVGIEQALLGTFDSGDWTWAHYRGNQSVCKDPDSEPEDEVVVALPVVKPPPLSRSSSATSNSEDTCDEELDRVLLVLPQASCRECNSLDKHLCLQTKYQHNELFSQLSQRSLRRASSFIGTMLRKSRDSFRQQGSEAFSLRPSSSFRLQASSNLDRQVETFENQPEAVQTTKEKSAWTIGTGKAATFLN